MLRPKHGITRQVYEAHMACLNQFNIEVYHGKTTTNTSYDMAYMNLNKVLTHETNMTSNEDNTRWSRSSQKRHINEAK